MQGRNPLLNISLFQLQAFAAVYEAGQTSIAAQNLQVTPSKVSRALSQLQHALDQPLLLRRQAGFEASDFGHQLYPQAKQLLRLAERCESYQGEVDSQLQHWQVACPLELGPSLQRHLQLDRDRQREQQRVDVVAAHTQIDSAFQQQQLQLVITPCVQKFHQYQHASLGQVEQLYLLAHPQHPVWQEPVSWSQLARYHWGLLTPVQSVFCERLQRYAGQLGARVDAAADLLGLQYQLERNGWIGLLSAEEAVSKMGCCHSVRRLQLPKSMLAELFEFAGQPQLHLVISPQVGQLSKVPPWLLTSLKGFVSNQLGLRGDSRCN